MIRVRTQQETVVRAAKSTLGQIKNPFELPQWLPELKDRDILRKDLIAGLTVALVLIPQSMAYAQLAGLPAHYGLYASLLPPVIAAFFGSSRQLATGPVAMGSLMTAAALEPLATAGSEAFIGYAVLLSLMVGLFQLAMGMFRLGVLLNFLSHPVILGFVNAAAIISAAEVTDAVAIHPGYGFLAENAGFAQACADAGIAPSAHVVAYKGCGVDGCFNSSEDAEQIQRLRLIDQPV